MFEELKEKETLTDGQVYIYALLNDVGYIKIGKTTNLYNRIKSLSGSNSNGHKIIQYYASSPTWLHSIEKTCHNHFANNRLKGTEWFDGLLYEDVIFYMNSLFKSASYERANDLRKNYVRGRK